MPDTTPAPHTTPTMKPSEIDGVQPNATSPGGSPAATAPSAGDSSPLVSSNAPAAAGGNALAPAPADLKSVIGDEALTQYLAKAGLTQELDEGQREKLRHSLFTGLQYTAMPANDPRLVEHAQHMGMDVVQFEAQLKDVGRQAVGLQQKGEAAVQRLNKNNEEGRRAMTKTVGTALISMVVGSVVPFVKLAKRFPSSPAKKTLLSLGAGIGSGLAIGTVMTKATTGGILKEQQSILAEGQSLQTQFTAVDQQAQKLETEFKDAFIKVHLQRALTEYDQGRQKSSSGLGQSAADDGMRPYTPVASAEDGQSAANTNGTTSSGTPGQANTATNSTGTGENAAQPGTSTTGSSPAANDEMKAYTPVASAEAPAATDAQSAAPTSDAQSAALTSDAQSASGMPPKNAADSNPAVPYTSAAVDNTLPPGSDAKWGTTYTTNGTGWASKGWASAEAQAAAESQAAQVQAGMESQKMPATSASPDVGAGGEAPKTSMDALVNNGPSMEPKSVQTQQRETSQNYSADAQGGSQASPEDMQAAGKFANMAGKQTPVTQRTTEGYAQAAADAKAAAGERTVA